MNTHEIIHDSITDPSVPRTRPRVGADRIGSVQDNSSPHLTEETKATNCTRNDIECQGCTQLAELNEQLGIDFDNSEREVRRLRRQVAKRETEIAKLKGEKIDARAEDVKTVVREWARLTDRVGKRAPKHIQRGPRADLVVARLEDGFTVDELVRAVGWLAEFPNVGPRGRVAADTPGSKRFDEIKYALDTEVRVQEILDRLDVPDPKLEPDKNSLRLVQEPRLRHEGIDDVLAALTARGCAWRPAGRDHWMAQCCVHEDRTPSLSLTVSSGRKVLAKCLGCDAGAPEVRQVLDLPWAVFMEADGA